MEKILGLSSEEVMEVRRRLGREPNETEWAIIDAEWSEHSSYKSSRALLRLFPTKGKRVLLGPGYDAGVVDVGGGYVVTVHIESHNHPSAIDPYGGASTGIGGVLRDIISVGSRPIGLVDVLRFGDPEKSGHSRWLFRNVVRGIADYGNCVGVPTVAGDIEFDPSFERNCLVDVACVGVGRKDSIVLGEARNPGDLILLIGGRTGRDGVGGAAFASKNLEKGKESERKSVQVPDPFMKKLLMDSLAEVSELAALNGMKDLGGGGLSTALSEVAAKGDSGVEVELGDVRIREPDMSAIEIMTSESQERMLLLLNKTRLKEVSGVLDKYEVPHSVIGKVTDDGLMRIRLRGEMVANLPAAVVAEAPIVPRQARRPTTLLADAPTRDDTDPKESLLALLSSPNISSRRWVYEQYDHEVGLRTVAKPGGADAAVLRLPHGPGLAVKADGNSRHSALDPRAGGGGCVAEACRNVVCVGGEPMAMVDHLQFGDPSDPEVYWSFTETVKGMAEYCRSLPIPVVGGKVSFYNEDAQTRRAINASPVAMVVGLVPHLNSAPKPGFMGPGETIFAVGETRDELGGSEYGTRILKSMAGTVPRPSPRTDVRTYRALLKALERGAAGSIHDCSRGGFAVALSELCIGGQTGAIVDLGPVPAKKMAVSGLLFSESHGRFIVSTRNPARLSAILTSQRVAFGQVGKTKGRRLVVKVGSKEVAGVELDALTDAWVKPMEALMS